MSLFGESSFVSPPKPLAECMRPTSMVDVLGQGEAKRLLNAFIEQGAMPSVVFWGPPGTGKTSLSRLMASLLGWEGRTLNATSASVKDIRQMAAEAKEIWVQLNRRTLLFIDEIHRLNKSQQDVLLPYVEDGAFVLAGSTTENPFFSLNHALQSRVQLVQLQPLSEDEIKAGIQKAVARFEYKIDDDALNWIATRVSGDLRAAFNTLASAAIVAAAESRPVNLDDASLCLRQTLIAGDRDGDNHFHLASAYQKSLRGSDVNAALYYLGRFLVSGEDPRFIGRRLMVCASEDVGNADPNAFILACQAYQSIERLGMPEAKIPLAQATIYVARAPKSNEAVASIGKVESFLKENKVAPVPLHLRPAGYEGAKSLGHGVGYVYSHDHPNKKQVFLPEGLEHLTFINVKPVKDTIEAQDLTLLLSHLQATYPHDNWFEIDTVEVADKLGWPTDKTRLGLNQLVQGQELEFKRHFKIKPKK